jgi:hypothetical protein
MATLRNLRVVVELNGKLISIDEIDGSVTARELLNALADRINLPVGTNAVLRRKLTQKQLLSQQTLSDAGVESGETLIADFERTAG